MRTNTNSSGLSAPESSPHIVKNAKVLLMMAGTSFVRTSHPSSANDESIIRHATSALPGISSIYRCVSNIQINEQAIILYASLS